MSSVNTSYKFVNVIPDGGDLPTTVVFNDKTSFITTSGAKKTSADIKVGQTLTVYGNMNGTLIADLIIIGAETTKK